MNKNSLFIILTAVIAVTFGVITGLVTSPPSSNDNTPQIQGIILPIAKELTEFKLLDQNNKPFNKQNLNGHWSLIFIGYTHCPDVCPTTLTTLKQVNQLMVEQQLTAPKMIFISIDPMRDNVKTLGEYIHYFDKDFTGATGEEKELKNIADQLAAYYRKVPGMSGDINGDDYMMEHSASLMLINPEAKLQAYLSAPHTPMQIINSIIQNQAYYN